MATSDKKVGYKSPPPQYRFKPGQSGNPAGRPKGSVNLATVMRRCLTETVEVTARGRKKTISVLEAHVRKLNQLAIGGDLNALKHVLQLASLAEHAEASEPDEARQAEKRRLLEEILATFRGNKAAPDANA